MKKTVLCTPRLHKKTIKIGHAWCAAPCPGDLRADCPQSQKKRPGCAERPCRGRVWRRWRTKKAQDERSGEQKRRRASGAAGKTKATRVVQTSGGWLRGIKVPFLCDAAVQPIVHPGTSVLYGAAVTAFWVPWSNRRCCPWHGAQEWRQHQEFRRDP